MELAHLASARCTSSSPTAQSFEQTYSQSTFKSKIDDQRTEEEIKKYVNDSQHPFTSKDIQAHLYDK
jgi:hypothetical protein